MVMCEAPCLVHSGGNATLRQRKQQVQEVWVCFCASAAAFNLKFATCKY